MTIAHSCYSIHISVISILLLRAFNFNVFLLCNSPQSITPSIHKPYSNFIAFSVSLNSVFVEVDVLHLCSFRCPKISGKIDFFRNPSMAANEYGDGVAWVRGPILGKGSFGRVYKATLKNPRSKYSCFPPLMAVKSAEVSCSGTIQKERLVMSNLNESSYLIRCFGEETTVGENGVMAYNLLLEYGSGGTLAELIKKSGRSGLTEIEVRTHTRSILRGLSYVHEMGYVHCDLKPDNILLVPSGRKGKNAAECFIAKIGDFGLAKRGMVSKTRKLMKDYWRGNVSKKRKLMGDYWRGTPMYLSPEAVTESVQEAPCDVWSVGCIVLEMLTGKSVWDEEDVEGILAKIGSSNEMPAIPDEISEDARNFLKRCFVRKSVYRFTAKMLLNHPFVDGLDTESAREDSESFDSVYGSGDEFAFTSDDNASSHWSEEGGENEHLLSLVEERETETVGSGCVISSSSDADCDQSTHILPQPKRRRHCSVIFSIPA